MTRKPPQTGSHDPAFVTRITYEAPQLIVANNLEKESDHPDQNTQNVGVAQWRIWNTPDMNDWCCDQNEQDTLKEKNLEVAPKIKALSPLLSPLAVAKIFRLTPIPQINVKAETNSPHRDKSSYENRPATDFVQ
jgi:hypothetical protein